MPSLLRCPRDLKSSERFSSLPYGNDYEDVLRLADNGQTLASQGSDRVPGEDVARPVERREGRAQHRQRGLDDAFRRPALAAVGVPDRPRLAEQEDLVVADGEDLPGDV